MSIQFTITAIGEPAAVTPYITSPKLLYEFWLEHITPRIDNYKEHLVVLTYDTQMQVTGWHIVAMGTLNECLAHPREIMLPVILNRAHSFTLAHNHPSGVARPSRADDRMTRRINDCANTFDIPLIDSIIIGKSTPAHPDGYYSYREMGKI